MSQTQITSTALFAIGLAATLTFVLMYAILAPTWGRTAMGRVLMGKAAVLSGLFGLTLFRIIFRSDLPNWIWFGGLATLDLLLWMQVWLLWRANRVKA